MLVKKSGKVVYGAELTTAERKALEIEVQKRMRTYIEKTEYELMSIYLMNLHMNHGFGEKRLKQAFEYYNKALEAMKKQYSMGDEDELWLATRLMKGEGFDIEQWYKEEHHD